MRALLLLTGVATLALPTVDAGATVIAPALGIAATEAEVGVQNQGTLTVQQA